MRKTLTLILLAVISTTYLHAQTEPFYERDQYYEYADGRTTIKMNCRGVPSIKNMDNDFGRHHETTFFINSTKNINYFQGTMHKDTKKQINAKRTMKDLTAHYFWQDGYVVEYIVPKDFLPDYSNCEMHDLEDNNTVDICGLLYLLRAGEPKENIEGRSVVIGKEVQPIQNVTIEETAHMRNASIKIGTKYHFNTRIRKDKNMTPEYLDINVPGMTTKASLVEFSKRGN